MKHALQEKFEMDAVVCSRGRASTVINAQTEPFAAQVFSTIEFRASVVRNVLLVSSALSVQEYLVDHVNLVKLAQWIHIDRTVLVYPADTARAVARNSAN